MTCIVAVISNVYNFFFVKIKAFLFANLMSFVHDITFKMTVQSIIVQGVT